MTPPQVAVVVGGVVLAVALALAAVAGYLLAVLYVAVPLHLAATTAGALAGAAAAAIGVVRGLTGLEEGRPNVTPDPSRRRWPVAPYPRWDDAWPHYLAGQVVRDVLDTAVWPAARCRDLWRMLADGFRWLRAAPPPIWFLSPLFVAAPLFVLAFATGALVVLLAAVLLTAAVAGAGWAAGAAAVAVLRPLDFLPRWCRSAAAVCPDCRWVTALPAYRCPRCRTAHNDIRPGLTGLWLRVCGCGNRLPTMVLRAARVLDAACPRCDRPLPDGAGVRPVVTIAVSGGPAGGKSALVDAALSTMEQRAAAAGRPWRIADRRAADPGAAEENSGPRTIAVGTTLRFRAGYLYLFDAPGASFVDDASDGGLHHLGTTRRHLLVVDPHQIGSGTPDRVDRPYRLMVEHIKHHGMSPARCSLAVTVTKMDTLWCRSDAQRLGLTGDRPPKPRDWLVGRGLDNLVTAADRDFARVRYFFRGAPPDGHFHHLPGRFADPSAPVLWLMRQHRGRAGFR